MKIWKFYISLFHLKFIVFMDKAFWYAPIFNHILWFEHENSLASLGNSFQCKTFQLLAEKEFRKYTNLFFLNLPRALAITSRKFSSACLVSLIPHYSAIRFSELINYEHYQEFFIRGRHGSIGRYRKESRSFQYLSIPPPVQWKNVNIRGTTNQYIEKYECREIS